MKKSLLVTIVTLLVAGVVCIDNGLERLPAMGWSTWCTEGLCCNDYCTEKEVKEVADALEKSGMYELGYRHIVLDDCWSATERDGSGRLQADAKRFPNGLQELAQHLHGKGMKLGAYTSAGSETCHGGRPGSHDHYALDANTLASWGIDWIKMDWCSTRINGTELDPFKTMKTMSDAMNATGRPMIFGLCEGGREDVWKWGNSVANQWRTGGDHRDKWGDHSGVAAIVEHNAGLSKYAGPGGWNDLDYLMTGGEECPVLTELKCPGMKSHEYVTEFSMWAIMNAPLVVATDVRRMDDIMKEVLLNEEVVAVNQDELGVAGDRIGYWNCTTHGATFENCQIWAKKLSDGTSAVCLYNNHDHDHDITLEFDLLGYTRGSHAKVRDLWSHSDQGVFLDKYSAKVQSHGVVMVKVTPM